MGGDGRLGRLQLEEWMGGVERDLRLVIKDYFQDPPRWHLKQAQSALADLSPEELLDLNAVAATLHLPTDAQELDSSLQPRGYRLLSKIPRLPEDVIEGLVARFGSLQKIMRATIEDLDDVEGVGDVRAVAIKDGLSRLAETSILERYS